MLRFSVWGAERVAAAVVGYGHCLVATTPADTVRGVPRCNLRAGADIGQADFEGGPTSEQQLRV